MEYSNIIISAFRASDDIVACLKFVEGHAEVLKSFGLGGAVTSSTPDWANDPNTIVITAECSLTGKLIAGIRVQIDSEGFEMPMVSAIKKMDQNVLNWVDNYRDGGVAEMCGLWTSRDAKGLNLGFTMMQAALVVARQLDIDTYVGFAAPVTLPFFQTLGFLIEPSLGDNGGFQYPTPEYISSSMILKDMKNLKYAEPATRARVMALTEGTMLTDDVETKRGMLHINYALNVVADNQHLYA